MKTIILISLLLQFGKPIVGTYTEVTVVKTYNTANYWYSTVDCKFGLAHSTKIITFADAGFGTKAYYISDFPFESSSKQDAILKTDGRYNSFDAAAQKACFG